MDAQKRIKQLMEERGWTDYRLAKEANLSHSTITNVFKRNNAPTLPTLEVICRAFGITLAQFFAEGGEAVEITDEQRELFAKWSTLTEKQKALLLEFISTLMSTEQTPVFFAAPKYPAMLSKLAKGRTESYGDSARGPTWQSHEQRFPAALQ